MVYLLQKLTSPTSPENGSVTTPNVTTIVASTIEEFWGKFRSFLVKILGSDSLVSNLDSETPLIEEFLFEWIHKPMKVVNKQVTIVFTFSFNNKITLQLDNCQADLDGSKIDPNQTFTNFTEKLAQFNRQAQIQNGIYVPFSIEQHVLYQEHCPILIFDRTNVVDSALAFFCKNQFNYILVPLKIEQSSNYSCPESFRNHPVIILGDRFKIDNLEKYAKTITIITDRKSFGDAIKNRGATIITKATISMAKFLFNESAGSYYFSVVRGIRQYSGNCFFDQLYTVMGMLGRNETNMDSLYEAGKAELRIINLLNERTLTLGMDKKFYDYEALFCPTHAYEEELFEYLRWTKPGYDLLIIYQIAGQKMLFFVRTYNPTVDLVEFFGGHPDFPECTINSKEVKFTLPILEGAALLA